MPETRNLVFFTEVFTFHTKLDLGDSKIRNEHQFVSVKELPRQTCAELIQQHFQHQDEEQCAKDRALMHTHYHAKLLAVQTIDPPKIPGIGVYMPIDRQQVSSIPTTGPSNAHNRRLSQGRQGQSRTVCLRWCTYPAAMNKMTSVVPLSGTNSYGIWSMFFIL